MYKLRYHPPNNTEEINTNDETSYVGDLTIHPAAAMQRYKYEFEPKKGVINDAFLERNRIALFAINKFMPLGNYNKSRTYKLMTLKFNNSLAEKDAGVIDNAEETALSIQKDIAMSRGSGGFAAKLETTEHKIWEDATQKNDKQGLFSRFMKNQNKEEQQAVMLNDANYNGY